MYIIYTYILCIWIYIFGSYLMFLYLMSVGFIAFRQTTTKSISSLKSHSDDSHFLHLNPVYNQQKLGVIFLGYFWPYNISKLYDNEL